MLYFFRHGQAGTRDNYDQLSELGQQQATLLGQYLAQQELTFDVVYTGSLQRQQHTARLALAQMHHAVTPLIDTAWNEFSLGDVYQNILPLLLADDEAFAADYAEMQVALLTDPHAVRGAVGRCDHAIITAWMNERFAHYQGETWAAFRARIQSALTRVCKAAATQSIAIFTSATPIAISVSTILQVDNARTLGLMAMLQNTSLTTLRIREAEAWLFNFNALPHLPVPGMRTFR